MDGYNHRRPQPGARRPVHRGPRQRGAAPVSGRGRGELLEPATGLRQDAPQWWARRGRQAAAAAGGTPTWPGGRCASREAGDPVRLAHRQSCADCIIRSGGPPYTYMYSACNHSETSKRQCYSSGWRCRTCPADATTALPRPRPAARSRCTRSTARRSIRDVIANRRVAAAPRREPWRRRRWPATVRRPGRPARPTRPRRRGRKPRRRRRSRPRTSPVPRPRTGTTRRPRAATSRRRRPGASSAPAASSRWP